MMLKKRLVLELLLVKKRKRFIIDKMSKMAA